MAQAIVCASLLTACGGQTADTPTTPSPSPAAGGSIFAPCPPRAKATLSGNVHDPAGKPVPGARVLLFIVARTGGCGATGEATSDTDGRYQARVDVVEGYILQVTKPGYKGFNNSSYAVRGDAVLDVTLEPGVTVGGLVSESGVGPLGGATVEVIGGPNGGTKAQTNSDGIVGRYRLDLVPGDVTLRVSKTGYDTVERTVPASVSATQDFVLKWTYGTCLQSVTPVSFDRYPSAGGAATVSVSATSGGRWTAAPDSPWIEVLSPATQTGSGQVMFRVLPHPAGSTLPRRGAVQIRCSDAGGQNVWVNQNPACQVRLESAADSPEVFGAAGGIGHLLLHVATPGCRWEFTSQADWIRTVGIASWSGDLSSGVSFVVASNPTGRARTGTVVVGDTPWQVTQQ